MTEVAPIGFSELMLSDAMVKAVQELGFTHPTEVQTLVIPRVFAGKDLVVKVPCLSPVLNNPVLIYVSRPGLTQPAIISAGRFIGIFRQSCRMRRQRAGEDPHNGEFAHQVAVLLFRIQE